MIIRTPIKFILIVLFPIALYGQFGPQIVISTDALNPNTIYAADLDGDGDKDVLSASQGDEKISWYENLDGLGSFGTQQVIAANLPDARSVIAADLDGDGDMDVIAVSITMDLVVWYENLDGSGNFGAQQIITSLADGAIVVFIADLDGDTDMDVLSASFVDNKIAWYENTDGQGSFGPQQIITTGALSTRDVYAADLDGDDDMDVLAVSTATDEVLWFENLDGQGSFGLAQVITSNANGVLSVRAADIDGDGDMDVLSASPSDNKVAWYENTDGQGSFGPQQVITTDLLGERLVYAVDIDNDLDMDVVSAFQEGLGGEIVWYENLDGNGNFGPHQVITDLAEGPRSVYSVDIDDDGDMDLLSASIVDHKIAWYENLTILGVLEVDPQDVLIYPNPTTGVLNINYSEGIHEIRVYNAAGATLLTLLGNIRKINLSGLASGVYYINLQTDHGALTKKVIKI